MRGYGAVLELVPPGLNQIPRSQGWGAPGWAWGSEALSEEG